MKVLKFGGTSVGSAENIRRIGQILENQHACFVVVSAFSGVTNELVNINVSLQEGKNVESMVATIESKAREIGRTLFPNGNPNWDLTTTEQISRLKGFIKQPNLPGRDKRILAFGEELSSSLLFLYLNSIKLNTKLVSALDFMRVNKEGNPDIELTKSLLSNAYEVNTQKTIFLTQGFIALNESREVDNLERGGSDYTATIIGACIEAESVEIWTDIDGLHNNDPRFVENTQPVRQLSMDEAAELAYFGAKILHPLCLQPLQGKNTPVFLKNTFNPEAEGTKIVSESSRNGIKSVASKDGIIAIRIKSARMLNAHGFLNKVFEIFNRHETSIDMITTSEIAVSLTIDDDSKLDEIVGEIEKFSHIEVDRNMSIVCIVGQNISNVNGITSTILSALECINIRMISGGGSRNNISLLVQSNEKVEVLNLLQNGIFRNNTNQNPPVLSAH